MVRGQLVPFHLSFSFNLFTLPPVLRRIALSYDQALKNLLKQRRSISAALTLDFASLIDSHPSSALRCLSNRSFRYIWLQLELGDALAVSGPPQARI